MKNKSINNLKLDIIDKAKELGFVKIGFTNAQALTELEEILVSRAEQGRMTPFEHKDFKARIDPKMTWPLCKSVVVLAYPLPLSTPPNPSEGSISRSAVGIDYHTVLKERLKELALYLFESGKVNHYPAYQVDTGPLVERAFAVRAGIGWIGKNNMLISPGYGSFISLGLLLLNEEIPLDSPSANQCGACKECIKACPAQILGSTEFDPTQCLSYLTQSKEELNPEQIKLFNYRIFGCDSCQEVCPHNYSRITEEKKSNHIEYHRGVNFTEILNMSKQEFNNQYKHTAAGWRGKSLLQRNALFALQNELDSELKVEKWKKEKESQNALPLILKPYL